MTRGILIAGSEGAVAEALAREAAKRVEPVVTAFLSSQDEEEKDRDLSARESSANNVENKGNKIVSIPWKGASSVSAQAVLLSARNILGEIDEALVVCTPWGIRRGLKEVRVAEIDHHIDGYLKSWFYLGRELTRYFSARERGTLALVLADGTSSEEGGNDIDMFKPLVAEAFRIMADKLLASSASEPFRVLAFQNNEAGNEEAFAAYVMKVIDENNRRDAGRWHRYGKGFFFGR
ncbi:hypothetical protein [Treponema sp. J25]|uniref:hypothetical protein n=1 Tax=Treponema sp. J25 TaxID=2094121 RepID=UPI00104A838E|nr:hypothetical protein [Treponema sp. J25]